MENMQKQWVRFVSDSQKCQEVVTELSKLYIILHEHVRQTILKCTLNLAYDPTEDCHRHLNTILDLLKRLNDPNDTYLKGIDASLLNKYQQQLYDLSQQVQKTLKTYTQVKTIDTKKLEGIKHVDNKQPFSLKDQLKRSEQRKLKSRSGRKRSHPTARSDHNASITEEFQNKFSQYKKKFLEKKQKLQKEMEGHVEKKRNQVAFAKKYLGSNLEDYFNMRRDLLNLQIVDQYTKKIIEEQLERPKKIEQQEHSDGLQNKLFPEFKIKTKFMKSQVKQNILNALADVKMQLLQEFHHSNLKKLSQGNPDTLITLVPPKKSSLSESSFLRSKNKTHSTMNLNQPSKMNHQNRNIRQTSLTRYPMAHKSNKPMIYKNGWSEQVEEEHRKTLAERLFQGKVPNLHHY